MYFIIGLGNPGEQYARTRHNVAWILFDMLLGEEVWEYDAFLSARVAVTELAGKEVVFMKPLTFMNRSGEVLPALRKKYKAFSPNRIVVVHDELDLLLGEVRVAFARGHAGHNGVKSIMQHLKTKAFWRLRVGIARKLEDGRFIKPPVLAPFSQEEMTVLSGQVFPRFQEKLVGILEGRKEGIPLLKERKK